MSMMQGKSETGMRRMTWPGLLLGLALATGACGGAARQAPTPAQPEGAADGPEDGGDDGAGQAAGNADQGSGREPGTGASAQPAAPEPPMIALPTPPFERFLDEGVREPDAAAAKVTLRQLSAKRNQITDEDAWFAANELTLPVKRNEDGSGAPDYRGVPLDFELQGNPVLRVYQHYSRPETYLVAVAPDSERVLYVVDFTAYSLPPGVQPNQAEFVRMELQWAEIRGEVLYVSHAHRTYAESSRGHNAYVTALRLPDGAILWRSQPLVSNTRNFALVPDPAADGAAELLLTGYGFTSEPDFLYVLDPGSGAVLSKTKLRSGPDYIIAKDGVIHVRTYDHDYQFRLQRGPGKARR